MEWRIRIHDVILPQAFLQWVEKRATEYLVVHHANGSERPHHHAWIKTDFAEQTIRKLPKDLKLTNGNSDFSIQKCDPKRKEEYLQQMFNLKNGNTPTFVAEKGVPDWKQYEERAAQSTEEYVARKKKEKAFTKMDMINHFLAIENPTYDTIEELYDVIMHVSQDNKTVFSINAIREIINYVAFHQMGNLPAGQQVKDSVLKIFR